MIEGISILWYPYDHLSRLHLYLHF